MIIIQPYEETDGQLIINVNDTLFNASWPKVLRHLDKDEFDKIEQMENTPMVYLTRPGD